jgi:hypothetical protein
MEDAMKENGLKITWKAWESTSGKMAVNTRVNIKMTKSMDSDNTSGLMEDAMRATGTEVNNTDSESTSSLRMIKLNSVFGKMESALNGSVMSRFITSTMVPQTTCSSSITLNQHKCPMSTLFYRLLQISMKA